MSFYPYNDSGMRSFTPVTNALSNLARYGMYYLTTGGTLALANASATLGVALFLSEKQSLSGETVINPISMRNVNPGDMFVADTTNNTSVAHNTLRALLDATGLVNNTGADAPTGTFVQVAVVGAAASKKAIVKKL